MAFGLFEWVDRREAPLAQLYEEWVELAEAAEATVFLYHLAKHSLSNQG